MRPDYELQPGESVTLMGNPSVQGGIVMRNATHQGKLRALVHIEGEDLYHIDANVNPGWSGGPVLDTEGRVIAVVAMKANDVTVAEIRGTMRKLDDAFHAAKNDVDSGIAYGIPGSALAKILQEETLANDERLAMAGAKFASQSLVDRLGFLASIAMLRMQANVPLQVRMEAKAFAEGRSAPLSSKFKIDYVSLMPEDMAQAINSLLHSRRVRQMENRFCDGLEARIDAVTKSTHVSDDVQRDVKALAKKIKVAAIYAERPAGNYAAFSVKFNAFSHDLKQLLERLEAKVDTNKNSETQIN